MKRCILLLLLLVPLINLLAQNAFNIQHVSSPQGIQINEIKFLDSLRGVAVSDGEILTTFNGGATWNLKFSVPSVSSLSEINIRGNTVICDGYDNVGPCRVTFHFLSSGYTYTPLTFNSPFATISEPILHDDTLWGKYIGVVKVGVLSNSYTTVLYDNCASIDLCNNYVCLSSQGVIYLRHPNLKTWDTITFPAIFPCDKGQIYYNGDSTLYAINTNVSSNNFISNDYGSTWSSLSSNGIVPKRFHFVEDSLILGSESGRLLYSSDGGNNFSALSFASTNYTDCSISKRKNGEYFVFSKNSDSIFRIRPAIITTISETVGNERIIELFPNPASDYLQIKSDLINITETKIYNSTGKVCFQASQLPSLIDLESFSNGIYFIQIRDSEGTRNEKFIIN